MKTLYNIPFFLYLLILYNVIALLPADPQTGSVLSRQLFSFRLMAGSIISIDINSLFLIIGLHLMYLEVLISTRSSASAIIRHTLSLIVFIIFLVEFIVVKHAGTTVFLILTLMALLSVVSGYTVSISSARRDIVVGR